MAERRHERAGRARQARSSRDRRPGASRPASRSRGRNPAPQRSTGPITGANSLDIPHDRRGDEDSVLVDPSEFDGESTDVMAALDAPTVQLGIVADDSDRDDADGGDPEVAEDGAVAPGVGARLRRRAAPRRRRVPAARALAARWDKLNPRRAIVLAVVIGFVALTLAMPLRTFFSQRAEAEQMRASNAALEREIAELTRKVNEQGDPAYTEAQARARLQYVRSGETPFVLEIPGREAAAQERKRAAQRAANPWYANLWDSVATPPTK